MINKIIPPGRYYCKTGGYCEVHDGDPIDWANRLIKHKLVWGCHIDYILKFESSTTKTVGGGRFLRKQFTELLTN